MYVDVLNMNVLNTLNMIQLIVCAHHSPWSENTSLLNDSKLISKISANNVLNTLNMIQLIVCAHHSPWSENTSLLNDSKLIYKISANNVVIDSILVTVQQNITMNDKIRLQSFSPKPSWTYQL